MNDVLSSVALSNLYTMGICSEKDDRQSIGAAYSMPDDNVRKLRAKLILEEAIETIESLGCSVDYDPTTGNLGISDHIGEPDEEGIIDGVCDTVYVCIGTLCSMGIPDLPHLQEVNRANNEKFPDGAIPKIRKDGKFLKPEGWQPPNHQQVQEANLLRNLKATSDHIVHEARQYGRSL